MSQATVRHVRVLKRTWRRFELPLVVTSDPIRAPSDDLG